MTSPTDPRQTTQAASEAAGDPRVVLGQELEHLEAQVDELAVDERAEASHDENFADSGQVAAEQGESLALANQLREQLDDVQRALAKLDDGTYGVCETCGKPIAAARLEAMPATRFCIEHAD